MHPRDYDRLVRERLRARELAGALAGEESSAVEARHFGAHEAVAPVAGSPAEPASSPASAPLSERGIPTGRPEASALAGNDEGAPDPRSESSPLVHVLAFRLIDGCRRIRIVL